MSKMLILSRRAGESILLKITPPQSTTQPVDQHTDEVAAIEITLKVLTSGTNFCRLGIAAPECCHIIRTELHQASTPVDSESTADSQHETQR